MKKKQKQTEKKGKRNSSSHAVGKRHTRGRPSAGARISGGGDHSQLEITMTAADGSQLGSHVVDSTESLQHQLQQVGIAPVLFVSCTAGCWVVARVVQLPAAACGVVVFCLVRRNCSLTGHRAAMILSAAFN